MTYERNLPLGIAVSLFIADRRARGHAPGTVRFYRDKLGLFTRWCDAQGIVEVQQVTPLTLRAYFAHLIERGNAQGAQNAAGRGIKTFLRWCELEELTDARPLRNVVIPQPPKQVQPAFTPLEIKRLLSVAPDARARAIALVLLDTGMRVSELCALDGGDVDVTEGQIRVRKGKGGKSRTVYLSAQSRRALLAYYKNAGWPEEEEPVWRTERTGVRLNHQGVRLTLKAMGKEASVKVVRPHQFRRTFALESLRAGVDLHTLARLMGHSDIAILRQYLDLDDTDTAEAHRRAAIVDRLTK